MVPGCPIKVAAEDSRPVVVVVVLEVVDRVLAVESCH
jgi:hypothetical protein